MPTAKKLMSTSKRFSAAEIAAAKAAADKEPTTNIREVDWTKGTITAGAGVSYTIATLRRARGPNKRPAKVQVAIRLDPEVVGALRASGPGWQTRVNTALKEWLASRPVKRKPRQRSAV